MRPLVSLLLALLAALLVLPSLRHDAAGSSGSSSLVAAAPAAQRRTATYASENRDLEEDDEDEEEHTAAGRRTQKAAAAQRRSAVAEEDEDASGDASPLLLRLSLQHAIGAAPFTPRGDVTLNFNPQRGSKALTFSTPQSGSKRALSDALKAAPQTLYRLRFVQEGQKEDEAIMASVPACALAVSHFHENFIFNVDPYGSLLSVSYRTPLSDCSSSDVSAALQAVSGESFTLTPKAKISFGKPGSKAQLHIRPGFDASSQANAQAVGAEPAAAGAAAQPETGADGKPLPPPQTFWQKYWIYIVPLGIFMVVQAVMAPPEQAGSAGGQGGSGGAPARSQ